MSIIQFLQNHFNYFSNNKTSHFPIILLGLLLTITCIILLTIDLAGRSKSSERMQYTMSIIHLSFIATLTGTHVTIFRVYNKYIQVNSLENIAIAGFVLTAILSLSYLITFLILIIKTIQQSDFEKKQYLFISNLLTGISILYNLALLAHLASQ